MPNMCPLFEENKEDEKYIKNHILPWFEKRPAPKPEELMQWTLMGVVPSTIEARDEMTGVISSAISPRDERKIAKEKSSKIIEKISYETPYHYVRVCKNQIEISTFASPYQINHPDVSEGQTFIESPMKQKVEEINFKICQWSCGNLVIGLHDDLNVFFVEISKIRENLILKLGYNEIFIESENPKEENMKEQIFSIHSTFAIKFDSHIKCMQIFLNGKMLNSISEKSMARFSKIKQIQKNKTWKWFLMSEIADEDARFSHCNSALIGCDSMFRLRIKRNPVNPTSLKLSAYTIAQDQIFSKQPTSYHPNVINQKNCPPVFSRFQRHVLEKIEDSISQHAIHSFKYIVDFKHKIKLYSLANVPLRINNIRTDGFLYIICPGFGANSS